MQPVSPHNPIAWFLFDNGSVRAESILSLRRVAGRLGERTGLPIQPVSLLHSSNVPAEELNGEPARLLEPAMLRHLEAFPEGEIVLVPLFFGPSAALTEYLPARIAHLCRRFPLARIRLARWLVSPNEDDRRLAEVLADQVRLATRTRNWTRPKVVLVDHGSPQADVAAVRDHLGRQVCAELGDEIETLAVASMERRDGDAYAFNEPLLATLLSTAPFDQGEVVVVLQFLSPGRHAGRDGDIARICAAAELKQGHLTTQLTEPIAVDPRLIDVLADRLSRVAD